MDDDSSDQQQAGFDLPGLTPAPAAPGAGYRVLARKYRPHNFDQLIGQDAMVRTLTNAIATGASRTASCSPACAAWARRRRRASWRAASTAPGRTAPVGRRRRRAANASIAAPSSEDRHVDVIEMDAASRTGIDDIRELIDGVRYRPVSARYKVYIIDEVHMLSKKAFNALLKTLEEPPEHVKFIFATTEIRKVPVTVLSRCQRFDLRRIEAGELVEHPERSPRRRRRT